MEISIQFIIGTTTGAILMVSAFAIYYMSEKSLSVRLFSFLAFFASIWSFLTAISTTSIEIELFLTHSSYFIGTIIASTFILFTLAYPDKKIRKKLWYVVIGIEIIFAYFLFYTNLIISKSIFARIINSLSSIAQADTPVDSNNITIIVTKSTIEEF